MRSEGIHFEAVIINYYECVSVFLSYLSGMHLAYFLRSIILSWLAIPYFSTLSHKWHDCREKKSIQMRAMIFSVTVVWNISH